MLPSEHAGASGSAEGRLVLLVDDDPVNHLICKELLISSGYAARITSFVDPRKALDWLERQTAEAWPDLILLDVHMAGIDSWAFLDELSRRPLKRPLSVKILTSSITSRDRERARAYALIEDYLIKPLTLEQLRANPGKPAEDA